MSLPAPSKIASGYLLAACSALAAHAAAASETVVPIRSHTERATFYVPVTVDGASHQEYLLDTGSGYMAITEQTLSELEGRGSATYVRELNGRMADGSVMQVPVYRLDRITVGATCHLRDVEAAVLPNASRGLLGLSALRKLAPFELSTDPPALRLNNCLDAAATTVSRQ